MGDPAAKLLGGCLGGETRRSCLRNLRADIRQAMMILEQTQAANQSLQSEYAEKVQSLQTQAADLSRIENIKIAVIISNASEMVKTNSFVI